MWLRCENFSSPFCCVGKLGSPARPTGKSCASPIPPLPGLSPCFGSAKTPAYIKSMALISNSSTSVPAPRRFRRSSGGDIDILYSAAGAVVDANLAGADLSMIGCQYDRGQTSFFTTAAVNSIVALKGRAVGVTRFGSFSDFVARHVLKKSALQPVKDVALIQLGGTLEIIASMEKNLIQGGSISLPLSLKARQLGFRELLTTETLALPFDYGCFILKSRKSGPGAKSLKKSCAPLSPPTIWHSETQPSPRKPSANTLGPRTAKLSMRRTKRT